MGLKVYDFRNDEDITNMLVTPWIRSRFLRMEPGLIASLHSHDLGHEIFLILQGRALFEIDGEEAELGPGQMCIALADQPHKLRVLGDEPMIMYLSVTPHIQPTHTGRTEEGGRMPIRFSPSNSYDTETDTETPVEELIDRYIALSRDVADAAEENAQKAARLKKTVTAGDENAAGEARNTVWESLYRTFKGINSLGDVWNALAPRAAKTP